RFLKILTFFPDAEDVWEGAEGYGGPGDVPISVTLGEAMLFQPGENLLHFTERAFQLIPHFPFFIRCRNAIHNLHLPSTHLFHSFFFFQSMEQFKDCLIWVPI